MAPSSLTRCVTSLLGAALAGLLVCLLPRTAAAEGPGFGWAPGFGPGDSALRMIGLGGELAMGFAQRISDDGVRLGLHVGARGEVLAETNADPRSYQAGQSLVNVQIVFVRTGVTWR